MWQARQIKRSKEVTGCTIMIYIASPYTHKNPTYREYRYKMALYYVYQCFMKGEPVFSPIVHNHSMAKHYDMPKEFEFWRAINDNFIINSISIRVLMLHGWRQSQGVTHEIAFAETYDKPVSYIKVNITGHIISHTKEKPDAD